MTNFLVISDKIIGGEWIATKRLFENFKKKYPSISYQFLVLERYRESQKRFSFIKSLIKSFIYGQSEIKSKIKNGKFNFIITSDYLWALSATRVMLSATKLIFMFHGMRSVPFRGLSDVSPRQIIIKILERLSWVLSDVVTVPSFEARDYIIKTGLLLWKKVFLVSNIVPPIFLVGNKRKKVGPRFKVLYSGRLAKYKGLENLIIGFANFVKKVTFSKLTIAYPSSSVETDVQKSINTLIAKYRLQKKVVLVRDSTEKELSKLYRKSDVSILPSELEFAPLSVLESLAAGTPVIGTDVGNMWTLLNGVDPGLVLEDNSPTEIVRKLVGFYKHRNSKKEILRKRCINAANRFSEDIAVGQFAKVLSFLKYNNSR